MNKGNIRLIKLGSFLIKLRTFSASKSQRGRHPPPPWICQGGQLSSCPPPCNRPWQLIYKNETTDLQKWDNQSTNIRHRSTKLGQLIYDNLCSQLNSLVCAVAGWGGSTHDSRIFQLRTGYGYQSLHSGTYTCKEQILKEWPNSHLQKPSLQNI